MCLIAVAWQAHPEHPFIIAANRDEFHRRPTALLNTWSDQPHIIGGRDLDAGGTWLACDHQGRFAAVTNVRRKNPPTGKESRGHLPVQFLCAHTSPLEFAASLDLNNYGPVNLVLGDKNELVWHATDLPAPKALTPGVYALSNGALQDTWPKMSKLQTALEASTSQDSLDAEEIFAALNNQEIAPDHALPDTGVGLDWERLLSPIKIVGPRYGTRCSTLITSGTENNWSMIERSFEPDGSVRSLRGAVWREGGESTMHTQLDRLAGINK